MMETDVGGNQNIVTTRFIARRAVGFATPMGTGAIMSTPTAEGERTGSATTKTAIATDKLEIEPTHWAPADEGPKSPAIGLQTL
jgi:hypothetical protein